MATVHARSRTTSVEAVSEHEFVVRVPEAPEQGRANAAVIRALAEHFNTSPSRVTIVMGKTARDKVIDIG